MASGDVSDEVVYVAELDTGERVTLKQEDFEKRFGWRNEPEQAKVQLDGRGRSRRCVNLKARTERDLRLLHEFQ